VLSAEHSQPPLIVSSILRPPQTISLNHWHPWLEIFGWLKASQGSGEVTGSTAWRSPPRQASNSSSRTRSSSICSSRRTTPLSTRNACGQVRFLGSSPLQLSTPWIWPKSGWPSRTGRPSGVSTTWSSRPWRMKASGGFRGGSCHPCRAWVSRPLSS